MRDLLVNATNLIHLFLVSKPRIQSIPACSEELKDFTPLAKPIRIPRLAALWIFYPRLGKARERWGWVISRNAISASKPTKVLEKDFKLQQLQQK